MRLLFLTNLYPPYEIGGYEQWCQEIAEKLRQKGHIVHILTSRYGFKNGLFDAENSAERVLFLQTDINHYRPLDFFLKGHKHERFNKRQLVTTINHFSPDLVVIWGMWNLSLGLPHLVEQIMPKRIAYYISSYWPMDENLHLSYWKNPSSTHLTKFLMKPLSKMALKQIDHQYQYPLKFEHTMCCSEFVKKRLLEVGVLPTSSGVIYGGIDPKPFLDNKKFYKIEELKNPLKLLFFGSLLPHKGVDTAIEAFRILQTKELTDNITLTILGGGHPDYEKHLKSLVNHYNLADKIQFAGRVPRPEIPQTINLFDVFLYTSIWDEPFGRTIVEAMASGLIVIGSDVGGSKEIFKHYPENMLFQPGDAYGLAQQVQKLLNDPNLLPFISMSGRQLVLEHFTLERMATNMENWFMSLM